MSPGSDAKQTAVYLLRGWRGLWSAGIDDLAAQLRQEGINASVYREEQWKPLADQIAADLARSGRRGPLVLIGFSYGADNVIEMARAMEARGIPVDLLVTIDPVTAAPVPRNVRECVNFYQSNGFWDIFPWLRGTPLKRDPPGGGKLVNYDLRKDRTDLLEPGTSHATIAGNAKLHRAIIELVENLIPKQGSQSARCNTTARPPFTSVPSITIGVSEIWS
ncbi:MAG: hypothetical protein JWN24_4552 [Phycisphaerales bacterium]|nr:hypothetical protein [Phycisphaerales bacterium]